MSFGNSRSIISNQDGVHQDLQAKVARHLQRPFLKPIAEHSLEAFNQVSSWIETHNLPVWLDSCCGVGASSIKLAEQHPERLVVGVDKSLHRLEKAQQQSLPDNLVLVRADLNDFWRLAYWAKWPLAQQTIFYPNPWPKSEHLGRRWHGAPVFPYILACGGQLEMRSNWKLYLEEFCAALSLVGLTGKVSPLAEGESMTPFEVKYQASGQQCWRLTADLSEANEIAEAIIRPRQFSDFFVD